MGGRFCSCTLIGTLPKHLDDVISCELVIGLIWDRHQNTSPLVVKVILELFQLQSSKGDIIKVGGHIL